VNAGRSTVAVLGAGGIMGKVMAVNLAKAGFDVRAWNRTPEETEALKKDGAQVLATAAEAVRSAHCVITMLSDLDAISEVMEGIGGALTAMGPESIWLQMSTIGDAGAERCAALARQRHVTFFDAPVLGTREPAEQRKLVVLASGPPEFRDRVQPVFDALGHKTMWLGSACAASKLKLVLNAWVLAVVESGAEIMTLCEGFGLDPALFFEALDGGILDLPYLKMKGTAMIERDFEPMFRLALAAKDAGLVAEASKRLGLDLPLLALLSDRLTEGLAEHGDQDISATYLTSNPPPPSAARLRGEGLSLILMKI
jgi:3-hydroxyisobutyrate dehydrogenase